MPPSRRKSDRQEAPQTLQEATDLLAVYVDAITQAEQLRADADASIAAIEAARDGALQPIEELAKTIFLQLRSWWAVEKDQMTDGKRKSIELAGCKIGERMTTPRLVHQGLKADDIIERLLDADWNDLVRTKQSLDKPAIIKMLQGDHAPQIEAFGVAISQKPEFFIDRAQPKPADPETVDTPDAEIREAAR